MFVSHGMNLALIFSIGEWRWGGGDSQMGNLLGSEHSFSALVLPGSWFYFRAPTLASLSARECNLPCLQCFPLLGFCSSLVRSPWLGCLCSEQMPGCNLMCLHLFLSLYLFAQRIARSAPKMYSAEYFFKTTHLLHLWTNRNGNNYIMPFDARKAVFVS